jgi:hypothetical protein
MFIPPPIFEKGTIYKSNVASKGVAREDARDAIGNFRNSELMSRSNRTLCEQGPYCSCVEPPVR